MPLQDRKDEALIRRAYAYFALLSAGLVVVVVLGAIWVAELQASRSAEEDAGTRAEVVAAAVQAGLADPEQGTTGPEFTEAVETAAQRAGVRAVLVWDASGTVVWSTRALLVGETFRLDPAVQAIFGASRPTVVEDGDRLSEPRPSGLLGNEVEVFSPIVNASGEQLVVESYVDPAALGVTRAETLQLLLPLGIVSLVLFQLVALLAGGQLARRVLASRRERVKLLMTSLTAVDHERHRLAQDLHDGVIQDLAAMRYAITGVMQTIPVELPDDPHSQLQRVCDLIEEELVSLRAMLGELLPVEREELPLPQTLSRLLQRTVPPTLTWSIKVDPVLEALDPGTAELVQRMTREGVRNAVRHARPTSLEVRVLAPARGPEPRIRVEVDDDGQGLSAGILDGGPPADGAGHHVGVRLLRDLVADLGGELTLGQRPGGGTRLVAEWPRQPAHTAASTL